MPQAASSSLVASQSTVLTSFGAVGHAIVDAVVAAETSVFKQQVKSQTHERVEIISHPDVAVVAHVAGVDGPGIGDDDGDKVDGPAQVRKGRVLALEADGSQAENAHSESGFDVAQQVTAFHAVFETPEVA
ncbi:ORFL66W [Human betaherpesvirus 5]|nr:ORFL66W [Human betaherpesvirus 5]QHX40372.1 ORFL66W [Human betaherpesvirus 5]